MCIKSTYREAFPMAIITWFVSTSVNTFKKQLTSRYFGEECNVFMEREKRFFDYVRLHGTQTTGYLPLDYEVLLDLKSHASWTNKPLETISPAGSFSSTKSISNCSAVRHKQSDASVSSHPAMSSARHHVVRYSRKILESSCSSFDEIPLKFSSRIWC